jgi:hypothetical protein
MTIKDWWQSKPIWLKGGVYTLSTYILVSLILFPFRTECTGMICIPLWIIPTILIILIPVSFFGLIIHSNNDAFMDGPGWTAFTLAVILYFLIGAIIGLIISKIKSKK